MRNLKIFLLVFVLLFAIGTIVLAQEMSETIETAVNEGDLGVSEPKILPGHPLYFLKDWVKGVQLALTFNKVKKAELKLKFANEKLVEAEKLVELKRDPKLIEKALNDFQSKIGEIAKENGENLKQFSEKLIHQQILHQKILERLENQVPPEVFEKIRKIRENHLEKFAQIIQKVEERKKEIIEKINLEKNSLVGVLKECKWTMGNICENNVGKCYCLEINQECKILCASLEQKEKLKDLVGEKVILFGVNENVASTKMCPCYIEYQEIKKITESPEVCPTIFDPVCGKDGKTYSNICFAKLAGVEINYKGECKEKECQTDADCPQPKCSPTDTISAKCLGVKAKCIEGKCQVVPVETPTCKNLCGDGICQKVVCMAVGCPCPETPESCPEDCKVCGPCPQLMPMDPDLETKLKKECEAKGGKWQAKQNDCGCYGPPECIMP